MFEVKRQMLFMPYEGDEQIITIPSKHQVVSRQLEAGDLLAQCDKADVVLISKILDIHRSEDGSVVLNLEHLDLEVEDYRRFIQTQQGIAWTDGYPHRTTRLIPEYRCWGIFKMVDDATTA